MNIINELRNQKTTDYTIEEDANSHSKTLKIGDKHGCHAHNDLKVTFKTKHTGNTMDDVVKGCKPLEVDVSYTTNCYDFVLKSSSSKYKMKKNEIIGTHKIHFEKLNGDCHKNPAQSHIDIRFKHP